MKQIPLTQGQYALVDDEDYEYLNQFRWYIIKKRNTLYAARHTLKREGYSKRISIQMHREILGITDPKIIIDHRDRNGINNQKTNMRIATVSENGANREAAKNSTSKYVGVSWHGLLGKWQVHICKNRKRQYVGVFKTESEAAKAYNTKAIQLHGEFANLNNISV